MDMGFDGEPRWPIDFAKQLQAEAPGRPADPLQPFLDLGRGLLLFAFYAAIVILAILLIAWALARWSEPVLIAAGAPDACAQAAEGDSAAGCEMPVAP